MVKSWKCLYSICKDVQFSFKSKLVVGYNYSKMNFLGKKKNCLTQKDNLNHFKNMFHYNKKKILKVACGFLLFHRERESMLIETKTRNIKEKYFCLLKQKIYLI